MHTPKKKYKYLMQREKHAKHKFLLNKKNFQRKFLINKKRKEKNFVCLLTIWKVFPVFPRYTQREEKSALNKMKNPHTQKDRGKEERKKISKNSHFKSRKKSFL